MIDRNARTSLADALSEYLSRDIDNFELDERISQIHTDDRLCFAIKCQAWMLYDDCRQHHNEGDWEIPGNTENTVRRWIKVLLSNTEWAVITSDNERSVHSVSNLLMKAMLGLLQVVRGSNAVFVENEYWPFKDEEQYRDWEQQVGTDSK